LCLQSPAAVNVAAALHLLLSSAAVQTCCWGGPTQLQQTRGDHV
jgi:hypothetical protein